MGREVLTGGSVPHSSGGFGTVTGLLLVVFQYILSGSDDFNLYMWKIPKDPEAGEYPRSGTSRVRWFVPPTASFSRRRPGSSGERGLHGPEGSSLHRQPGPLQPSHLHDLLVRSGEGHQGRSRTSSACIRLFFLVLFSISFFLNLFFLYFALFLHL